MKKLFLLLALTFTVAGIKNVNAQCSASSNTAYCFLEVTNPNAQSVSVWDSWYITPEITLYYIASLQVGSGSAYVSTDNEEETFTTFNSSSHTGALESGEAGYLQIGATIHAYNGGLISVYVYW